LKLFHSPPRSKGHSQVRKIVEDRNKPRSGSSCHFRQLLHSAIGKRTRHENYIVILQYVKHVDAAVAEQTQEFAQVFPCMRTAYRGVVTAKRRSQVLHFA